MNAAFTESLNTQVIRSPNALLKRWRGFELVFFRRRVRIRHEFVEGICQLGLPLLGEVHFACADLEVRTVSMLMLKTRLMASISLARAIGSSRLSFTAASASGPVLLRRAIATLTCTGVLYQWRP